MSGSGYVIPKFPKRFEKQSHLQRGDHSKLAILSYAVVCTRQIQWSDKASEYDLNSAKGSATEQRLLDDLFRGYHRLVRPVRNITHTPVQVSFSLALILLINVVSSAILTFLLKLLSWVKKATTGASKASV